MGAADIARTVEREVRAGRVPRGICPPPVRVLERQLGLPKNTAQAAYDELTARGLITTRAREGVFVVELEEGPPLFEEARALTSSQQAIELDVGGAVSFATRAAVDAGTPTIAGKDALRSIRARSPQRLAAG